MAKLSKLEVIQQSYLAGGTALALQFGHRESHDLDFFTQQEFDSLVLVQNLRKQLKDFELERTAWATILGKLGEVKFSLFYYKYPLLEPTHEWQGIQVADVIDIAAMKIAAIADRGTKRDFVDLYFLLRRFKLEELLVFFDRKFGLWEQQQFYILKALVYFDDAEPENMPEMLEKIEWKQVKEMVSGEVREYVRKLNA